MSQDEMSREAPIVSVVIPCFNQGQFLLDAIESVLSQTLVSAEVIVVDDGSSDDRTQGVLENLDKPRTSLLRQRNEGVSSARNAGVRSSRGTYMCCLDADDTLEPTYLEKAVALLESRPDVGFAYPWTRRFGSGEGVWLSEAFDFRKLVERNLLTDPAVFRKKAWELVGGFWDGLKEGYEDWEFWISVAAAGFPGALIPEVLFNYRKHGPSRIDKAVSMHEQLVSRIRSRHASLYEVKGLVDRIQASYQDRMADAPFHNLNSSRMYSRGTGPPVQLILTDLPIQDFPVAPLASTFADAHSQDSDDRFLVVTSSPAPRSGDDQISPLFGSRYNLPTFLPAPCHSRFVANFLQTTNLETIIATPGFPFMEALEAFRELQPGVKCTLYVHETPDPNRFTAEQVPATLFDEILTMDSVPIRDITSRGYPNQIIRVVS